MEMFLPNVRLCAMTCFHDNLRGHPIRRPLHWLKNRLVTTVIADVDAKTLRTAKVNQFDDSIVHDHHIAALDVPVDINASVMINYQ